jgi:hypothetical protein
MIQQKGSATATYVCNSVGLIVVSYQKVLEHVRGDKLAPIKLLQHDYIMIKNNGEYE